MLASHLEDHNTVGQWMAHHLAELIVAAQDDATTTVEQRQQIVETILNVWAHRHHYPSRGPLEEFSNVLVALDRLGDSSPWKFSQLFDADTEIPYSDNSDLPLITTAAELERLTRETLLRLIWLAAQDAKDKNHQWLEVADKVATNIESKVAVTLSRLRRQAARHRLRLLEADLREIAETATETPDEDSDAEGEADDTADLTEGMTDDIVKSSSEHGEWEPFDDGDDDETNPLSNINHAKRLRQMADLFNKIADGLTFPESPA